MEQTPVRSWILISVLGFGLVLWPSCGRVKAAGTELPSPEADDRPPGSPPELPRVSVELPPEATPSPARVLSQGDDLEEALADAKPGDVIALAPGAIFKGPFKLSNKSGDGWITIRTNASDAVFPKRGTRAGPSDARMMPIIESESASAISAEPRAHHYRFIGIEFRPRPGQYVTNLIELGTDETSIDDTPHHIVFERCYLHGDPKAGSRRGIALNSRHTAVIDSYVADFKEEGADSQAFAGWNGAGPFSIVNNYLEAAGENLIFGGADPGVKNLVPSDIEIRGNHFAKPLTWRIDDPTYAGTPWSVKNLLELKNARRVLIDENLFEYNWPQSQNGYAILFTPRNQDGGSPWSMVRDVTFTRNTVRHSAAGVNILGFDDLHPSQQTKRILIRDNLFDDIGGTKWDSGRLFQIMSGTADVVIDHNTAFTTGEFLIGDDKPNPGFVFTNNIAPWARYGMGGSNTYGDPSATLNTYFTNAVFSGNVLVGARPDGFPAGNYFPLAAADVGFVNLPAGDYRLQPTSPYKNSGRDGKDIGADFDAPDVQQPGRRRAVRQHG